jgi:hypothetical protein
MFLSTGISLSPLPLSSAASDIWGTGITFGSVQTGNGTECLGAIVQAAAATVGDGSAGRRGSAWRKGSERRPLCTVLEGRDRNVRGGPTNQAPATAGSFFQSNNREDSGPGRISVGPKSRGPHHLSSEAKQLPKYDGTSAAVHVVVLSPRPSGPLGGCETRLGTSPVWV